MEIEEKKQWKEFKANVKSRLTQDQYRLLCRLHAKYYEHNYHEPCSCNPKRLLQWISDIDKVYEKC